VSARDDLDWQNPDYDSVFKARAERLARILREAERDATVIPALKAYYRERPVDFICDWGMTFDPRNAEIGQPSDIPFLLFPKQVEFIEWAVSGWRNRENGLVEKSRDMGATWLAVGIAVWMWVFHPGTVVGFGSRKEEYVDKIGDMKAIFPKIRFFIAGLPREFRPAGFQMDKHAPFMRIFNPETGSQIVGEAGDSIGRGARASMYFVDESAFLERPQLADSALSQTTNCRMDISTPNGESNPFAAKRFSGKANVFTLHWSDHPAKTKEWYEEQKRKIDDPVVIAQELDIDYKASATDQFIRGDLIDEAQRLDASTVEPTGPLKLGIDVARFGSNKTVFALRRGRVVFWVKEFNQRDTMEVVALAKDEIESMPKPPDQVAIDAIGVGAGVYDRLRQLLPAINVVSVTSSENPGNDRDYNLRAKMWRDMRDWLKDKPAVLPADREIKMQLTGPRYSYRKDLLLIEGKEDMEKRGVQSPDKADAIALTFAHPAAERTERARRERNWRTA